MTASSTKTILFLCVIALSLFFMRQPVIIPNHLLGHEVKFFPNLLSPETRTDLMKLAQDLGAYPSVLNTESFYKMNHEHIGEAEPIGLDGKCNHYLLMPTQDKTQCILPGRADVGKWYISTGGTEGLKEQYEDLISRLNSFMFMILKPEENPTTLKLFNDEKFIESAKSVCPKNKQILDPFQTNIIIQVPGQTVATHIDGVYFKGASRFHVPQWLLAVMKFSGLFEEEFVDQIQVVAYIHNWEDEKGSRGGQFLYWDSDTTLKDSQKLIPANPGSGSVVDGSKVVHSASVYRREESPPLMDKSQLHTVKYDSDRSEWELKSDDKLRKIYKEDDLRFSVVYRARCFETEEEKAEYKYNTTNNIGLMDLEDDILTPLKNDLITRKRTTNEKLLNMTKLNFALLLMDEYVRYPSPDPKNVLIPVNYCAASRMFPQLKALVDFLCPLNCQK